MESVLLAAIVLVLASILFTVIRMERFDMVVAQNEVVPQRNPSNEVWERHPIRDSFPFDYKVEYPTIYYNELTNKEFQDALVLTFSGQMVLLNGAEWVPDMPVDRNNIPPPEAVDAYKRIVPWFLESMQRSPYFAIPGDDPAPFQVVHDHWVSWSRSLFTQGRLRHNLEVLVYREAKYHGKHISLQVVTEGSRVVGVMNVRVVGMVPEDKFGLFPVVPSDRTDLENSNMPFSSDPLAEWPPLIDEDLVQEEVSRRRAYQEHLEKINKLYKLEPYMS